jgi:hypothetical protein
MAGFLIGVGSFFYAVNFSKYGLKGNGILGPITVPIMLTIKMSRAIVYRCRKGTWLKPAGSNLVQDEAPRNVKWRNLIPVLGSSVPTALYTVLMTYAW